MSDFEIEVLISINGLSEKQRKEPQVGESHSDGKPDTSKMEVSLMETGRGKHSQTK